MHGIRAAQPILFLLQRPTHPRIDLKGQKVQKISKNNHETFRNRPKFVYHKVPEYTIPSLTPDVVHKAHIPPPGTKEKQSPGKRITAFDQSFEIKFVGKPPEYAKR